MIPRRIPRTPSLALQLFWLCIQRRDGLVATYPPTPRIASGPDASIDLHWKQKEWELLVNIPKDDSQMAVFYGDDYGSSKIKGSFDPETINLGIVNWLMH